ALKLFSSLALDSSRGTQPLAWPWRSCWESVPGMPFWSAFPLLWLARLCTSSPSYHLAARLTRQELLSVTVQRLTFCEVHCKSILGYAAARMWSAISLL